MANAGKAARPILEDEKGDVWTAYADFS